jgi:nickel-dependent lactate racemase
MQVRLPYGTGALDVALPDTNPVEVLAKRATPPLPDALAAVRHRLAHPTAARPLAELARGRRNAVIVVSDATRPVPHAAILPPVFDALAAGGLRGDRVTLQVATGLHRPSTRAELDAMLGSEIARSARIVQHDARDAASHVDLGRTSQGMPILIDRHFVESDLRILTGLIEPHLMAGYSGGRKALCPGLAAIDTIRFAHGASMLEGQVGPGIVDGNPLHAALVEVLRRVGADFVVNVAVDDARHVTAVFAGHPEAAHAAGMAFVAEESTVALDRPADLVVTSAGGAPLDATFYQAIKGISAAASIVRNGGAILLCASLAEGVGSASFEALLRESASAGAFDARLAGDPEFFAIDQWMVQALCQAHRRARILLYTDALPPAEVALLLVEPAASPEAGIADALAKLGPDARIAVLPQGPYVLATVRRGLRSLAAR